MTPSEGGFGPSVTAGERDPDARPVARIRIEPRRLALRLALAWLAIELGLIVLDYQLNYGGSHFVGSIRRLANYAREDGLANLMAVLQEGLLSLTLWAVYLTERQAGSSAWRRRGWLVIALLFSYMTIDDGAHLHERFGTAFGQVVEGWGARSGGGFLASFPSYMWQVLFLPFFAVLGLFTVVFLWKELKPEHSRTLVVAGIGCFVLAVGLDFLEGLDETHWLNPYTWLSERIDIAAWTSRRFHETPYNTLAHFAKVLEEFIEMLGTTLVWLAVIRHWMRSVSELRVRFTPE